MPVVKDPSLMRSAVFCALLCLVRPTAEVGHLASGRVCLGLRLRGGDGRLFPGGDTGDGGMGKDWEEDFHEGNRALKKVRDAGRGDRPIIGPGRGSGDKNVSSRASGRKAIAGGAEGPHSWGAGGDMEDMGEDAMFDVGDVDVDEVEDAGKPSFQEGFKKRKKRSRRRQDMINRRKDRRGKEGGDGDTGEAWKKVRGAHIGDHEGGRCSASCTQPYLAMTDV